ncbi:hypothetical protein Stsp02_52350 [Streptomyces sp. NBRC 14336]|nr:hypothetical protein Stsp02_52350 [Streptomyces sp. NBRC 14336]
MISGRMSRFSNCEAMAWPISSLIRGTSTGSPGGHALEERGVRGERHGLADGDDIVPAAGLVGVLDGDPVPHGGGVGHAVGESLARDDLFAQVGPGDVGEAGYDGLADLDDGLREVQGGADAAADLVEELQALADRRVLQVLALPGRLLGQGQAEGGGARGALPAGPALGPARHAPVGGDGHPVVLTELQDGIAQFEDLGDDPAALAHAHAGQDLGQPGGQFLGAGEVGVQGEPGRDALVSGAVLVVVLVLQSVGVGGEDQQPLGAGADERVGPPQDVGAVVVGDGEAGAARGGVGEPAVEGGLQVGAEAVVVRVRAVRQGVDRFGQGSGDGQQIGGGAADRLLLGDAEQPPCADAPVGHQALAVHDHDGERDATARGVFRHAVPSSEAGRCVPLGATVHGQDLTPHGLARSAPPTPRYGESRG